MVLFGILKELAQKEISDVLEKYSGTKALVWDEGLTGPFDLVARYQFFKERGVEKMFPLKGNKLSVTGIESIIFITRPEIANMDLIATSVMGEESSGSQNHRVEYHILFVPSKSLLCEMRLKDKGVYGSFTYLDELAINWFPIDSDVVSLEKSCIFRKFYLDKDPTCLFDVARAMLSLQAVFGFIPVVYGKGRGAKQLYAFMDRIRKEHLSEETYIRPQIDKLIIIDRQVDLVTPLITQLTYEGLIDEFYTIKHGSVRLPADKFASSSTEAGDRGLGSEPKPSTKTFQLNSNEELFCELRDKNFNAVGPTLGKKARAMQAQFEERHGAKTVRDLKLFVDKMPQMQAAKQSLTTHTSIAELIKEQAESLQFLEFLQVEQELVNFLNTHRALDFIEDACCQDVSLKRVLRIACLQSVVNSGLKPKLLDAYRRVILQTYGHEHLLSLMNLDKAGLLCPQPSGSTGSNYAVIRKRLHLTQDDVNELNPTDITYVHSVYAPLSVRLVENCTSPGWRSIKDVLDLLSGPSFEEQTIMPTRTQRSQHFDDEDDVGNGSGVKRTLVLFLGGCTFAEISALRFLSQQEDAPTEYLVATTAIITGDRLIEGLMTNVENTLLAF